MQCTAVTMKTFANIFIKQLYRCLYLVLIVLYDVRLNLCEVLIRY